MQSASINVTLSSIKHFHTSCKNRIYYKDKYITHFYDAYRKSFKLENISLGLTGKYNSSHTRPIKQYTAFCPNPIFPEEISTLYLCMEKVLLTPRDRTTAVAI